MTRKQGITKRWQLDRRTSKVPPEGLYLSEYGNYTDNCYYCLEKPLPYSNWLEEQIKPSEFKTNKSKISEK